MGSRSASALRGDACIVEATWMAEIGPAPPLVRGAAYAAAISLDTRKRLYEVATVSEWSSVRDRPRNRVRLSPPNAFIHPKTSSIRFRTFWFAPYPGCRVVRPSMAEPRLPAPFWYCVT